MKARQTAKIKVSKGTKLPEISTKVKTSGNAKVTTTIKGKVHKRR